jgi:hypothetical protein
MVIDTARGMAKISGDVGTGIAQGGAYCFYRFIIQMITPNLKVSMAGFVNGQLCPIPQLKQGWRYILKDEVHYIDREASGKVKRLEFK